MHIIAHLCYNKKGKECEYIMKTYKYGTHNRHELDLYEASSNDLLIVGLHGGSWIQGDKSSLANYGLNFSKKWHQLCKYQLPSVSTFFHSKT